MDLRYVRCKVIGDLRSIEGVTRCTRDLDEGFRRRGLIQSVTEVTYGVNTRSRVKVLTTGEDIHYLGKRDQSRRGENEIGAI